MHGIRVNISSIQNTIDIYKKTISILQTEIDLFFNNFNSVIPNISQNLGDDISNIYNNEIKSQLSNYVSSLRLSIYHLENIIGTLSPYILIYPNTRNAEVCISELDFLPYFKKISTELLILFEQYITNMKITLEDKYNKIERIYYKIKEEYDIISNKKSSIESRLEDAKTALYNCELDYDIVEDAEGNEIRIEPNCSYEERRVEELEDKLSIIETEYDLINEKYESAENIYQSLHVLAPLDKFNNFSNDFSNKLKNLISQIEDDLIKIINILNAYLAINFNSRVYLSNQVSYLRNFESNNNDNSKKGKKFEKFFTDTYLRNKEIVKKQVRIYFHDNLQITELDDPKKYRIIDFIDSESQVWELKHYESDNSIIDADQLAFYEHIQNEQNRLYFRSKENKLEAISIKGVNYLFSNKRRAEINKDKLLQYENLGLFYIDENGILTQYSDELNK
jgi:hypothetical protein